MIAENNSVGIIIETKQPPPVAIRLALFLRPCFVVGIPVALDTFLFTSVTPVRRFMLNPYVFLLAMLLLLLCCFLRNCFRWGSVITLINLLH